MQAESKQWQAVRRIHADEKAFFQMAGGVGLFAVLGAVGLLVFAADRFGYQMNVYTELISVALTILVLDRRAVARAQRDLKEQLLFELGSNEHVVAMRALLLLRHKGWLGNNELVDRNLSEADLSGAKMASMNLERASLDKANLAKADMHKSNMANVNLNQVILESAILYESNLSGANLREANLSGADLSYADLTGVSLSRANLSNAHIVRANLSGADLRLTNLAEAGLNWSDMSGVFLGEANLMGADLGGAIFDSNTILPDAEVKGLDTWGNFLFSKYWTPDTDMTRYTDPNHPDFWQPEWAKTPGTDDTES